MNTIQQALNENLDDLGFESKTIVCVDCSNEFAFSAGEQKYYRDQGFTNQPKRCPNCRVVRRMVRSGQAISSITRVNCAQCNNVTALPFSPVSGKPIYCTACFIKFGAAKKAVNQTN